MNVVQMIEGIAFLNDRESSSRFLDEAYMKAINSAITRILEDRLDNIKMPKRYSFESVQRVRDELYTLVVPTLSITPIGNTLAYPANYNYFLKLDCTIDGVTSYARPTSFNELGPLLENPWKAPSNTKPYYEQNLMGFVVYRGATGSFTAGLLDYIKNPDVVSVGNESDKISAGASALTIGVVYMAYEDSVHNGVTYVSGSTFTAVSAVLTSGMVIPNSVIVNCNLPEKIHQEVMRTASQIMQGSIEDFAKKQDLKTDNAEA